MEVSHKKQFKGKTSKVCFIWRRLRHFAKNCLKKEKAAKLLEQAQIHAEDIPFSDVESLFSLDGDYSPQALAVMAYSSAHLLVAISISKPVSVSLFFFILIIKILIITLVVSPPLLKFLNLRLTKPLIRTQINTLRVIILTPRQPQRPRKLDPKRLRGNGGTSSTKTSKLECFKPRFPTWSVLHSFLFMPTMCLINCQREHK